MITPDSLHEYDLKDFELGQRLEAVHQTLQVILPAEQQDPRSQQIELEYYPWHVELKTNNEGKLSEASANRLGEQYSFINTGCIWEAEATRRQSHVRANLSNLIETARFAIKDKFIEEVKKELAADSEPLTAPYELATDPIADTSDPIEAQANEIGVPVDLLRTVMRFIETCPTGVIRHRLIIRSMHDKLGFKQNDFRRYLAKMDKIAAAGVLISGQPGKYLAAWRAQPLVRDIAMPETIDISDTTDETETFVATDPVPKLPNHYERKILARNNGQSKVHRHANRR